MTKQKQIKVQIDYPIDRFPDKLINEFREALLEFGTVEVTNEGMLYRKSLDWKIVVEFTAKATAEGMIAYSSLEFLKFLSEWVDLKGKLNIVLGNLREYRFGMQASFKFPVDNGLVYHLPYLEGKIVDKQVIDYLATEFPLLVRKQYPQVTEVRFYFERETQKPMLLLYEGAKPTVHISVLDKKVVEVKPLTSEERLKAWEEVVDKESDQYQEWVKRKQDQSDK